MRGVTVVDRADEDHSVANIRAVVLLAQRLSSVPFMWRFEKVDGTGDIGLEVLWKSEAQNQPLSTDVLVAALAAVNQLFDGYVFGAGDWGVKIRIVDSGELDVFSENDRMMDCLASHFSAAKVLPATENGG